MNRCITCSVTLALVAASAASAMQTELQSGGLVIGQTTKKDYDIDVQTGVESKYIDHGFVLIDDAVARAQFQGRAYGLGLRLEGTWALGKDQQQSFKTVDPAVINSRKVNPGATVGLEATIDFLLDLNGVYADNTPFLQLRPYLDLVTHPNMPEAMLKDQQTWLGVDLWLATPLPGVELGMDHAWDVRYPAYRGGFGARELYQQDNFDVQFWQVLNWGNRHNRALYQGYEAETRDYNRGTTFTQLGAKVTMPMPYREWWIYSRAEFTYWTKGDDRDYQQDVLGRDGGNLEIGIGLEWMPERVFDGK